MRSGVHGSGLLAVTVDSGNADVPIIDMEPVEIKGRFMRGDIGGLRWCIGVSRVNVICEAKVMCRLCAYSCGVRLIFILFMTLLLQPP